jgi:hypothetical protein
MAFVLKGEVQIDGSKATAGLRGVQQQATKTANTFKQSDASAQKLGKTLVGLGLNANKAGTSLGLLARLGAGGIFGYAVIGGMNKFGEAVKQASTDYYSAQKDLADAFETSFKSTSVDQARAGVEKTQDTIESLRGKITQLGATGGILKALESFTGINLGVGDTEKAIKDAQENLVLQEEILRARKNEEDVIKSSSQNLKTANVAKELKKISNAYDDIENGGDSAVANAREEVNYSKLQLQNYQYQVEEIFRLNGALQDRNKIEELRNKISEAGLQTNRAELALVKAVKNEEARRSKQAQQAGGGLLGATSGGQQALDTERKKRARQVKSEDFKTQEKFFNEMAGAENLKRQEAGLPLVTAQSMREKVAAQQAAGEMPSLSERIQGDQTGVDPSQLARMGALSKFEKDRSFPKGGATQTATGYLGEEKSSLSNETLQAIMKLVELMQSGTVVK